MIAPSRIVIVNDITVAKGGATGLAMASAAAFRRRNLAVTYLTGDQGQSPELADLGVDIVGLGQGRLLETGGAKALATGLYNRAAERMVAEWIAANDTPETIYHLHGWAQILSPSVFQALKPVSDRLVVSAHDFFLACPNGAYAFLKSGAPCSLTPMSLACVSANCDRRSYVHKVWRVARQAVRLAVYSFDRYAPPVLTIHETMRDYLVRGGIPSRSIETVPNPVRPFLPTRVAAEANSRFVFIGRLEEGKGPDLACAAAERAGASLLIIGDGPMRAELEARYPGVVFAGRRDFAEIGSLVGNCRALLMPSRYPEPYGLVAAEALWSGLPVIAADTAFLAKDIVEAEAGLSVAPRDTEAFAGALRRLMGDDDLVRRMSENAFQRTQGIGLTFSDWIDRLLAAYAGRLTSGRLEGGCIDGDTASPIA